MAVFAHRPDQAWRPRPLQRQHRPPAVGKLPDERAGDLCGGRGDDGRVKGCGLVPSTRAISNPYRYVGVAKLAQPRLAIPANSSTTSMLYTSAASIATIAVR